MKKLGLFVSLLTCSIILTGCSDKTELINDNITENTNEYNNIDNNIKNEEYKDNYTHTCKDSGRGWSELYIATKTGTTIEYIANIIGDKYVCYGGTNDLKSQKEKLPNYVNGYRFTLNIAPDQLGKEILSEITQNLKDDDNVYDTRLERRSWN